EKGCCLGIFPEGHVSEQRKLSPAQGGVIFIAQRTGAPIVPAAIRGNWDVLPRGAKFPKFKKITVVFGEPIVVKKDASKQEAAAAADLLMARIAEMLGVPPPEKAPAAAATPQV